MSAKMPGEGECRIVGGGGEGEPGGLRRMRTGTKTRRVGQTEASKSVKRLFVLGAQGQCWSQAQATSFSGSLAATVSSESSVGRLLQYLLGSSALYSLRPPIPASKGSPSSLSSSSCTPFTTTSRLERPLQPTSWSHSNSYDRQ